MGFIPQEVIQQVLERCDIVTIISSYFPLKANGRNFKACCPFHQEKTPSFIVNPHKQIFHCFGCGVGGNVISFVMQYERQDFPQAVGLLADKVGISIGSGDRRQDTNRQLRQQILQINEEANAFFHHNLLYDKSVWAKAARDYLKQRGIDVATAQKFQLGFALNEWDALMNRLRGQDRTLAIMEQAGLIIAKTPGERFYDRFRNRIIFPICDAQNRCVAFGARTMDPQQGAKYINSPETEVYTKGRHLYGLPFAKEAIVASDQVIIVEGYMDFITPFMAGVHHMVASLGTALTTDQIRLVRRYTENVVMLFDADPSGQAAIMRSLDTLLEEGMNVRVATLPNNDDPDSFVRREGKEAFLERIHQASSLVDFKLQALVARHTQPGVENAARIAAQMLPTINRFPNAVLQVEYIRKLARTLSLNQDALLEELHKIGSPSQAHPRVLGREVSVGQKPLEHMKPVESDLLRLMLDEPEFVPLTHKEIILDDFSNDCAKEIVRRIFTLFEAGKELTVPSVMGCFEDPKILRVISQLMASMEHLVGDKKKMHGDCVRRLKKERYRLQRQSLLQEMGAAERLGDQQRLDELRHQFNQLVKGSV
jgi:DNA primase